MSEQGFEALRLSIWGARKVFGPSASYLVCLNSVPVDEARRLTGPLPDEVRWHLVGRDSIPGFLLDQFDSGMAEGVGWKFAPLRVFPDRFELALDNDCILWAMPAAVARWLHHGGCLLAADVVACFGQFSHLCGSMPRNSGIRGLPPGYDLEKALRQTLAHVVPQGLGSELDEQGLQVATLMRDPCEVVPVEDVTICSPFPPHLRQLGRCGAHFVGLNAKRIAWAVNGRPGHELTRELFESFRAEVQDRVRSVPLLRTDEPAASASRPSSS